MIMAINVEQTKKYYKDIKQEDLCDCNYCKNYYLQVNAYCEAKRPSLRSKTAAFRF